MKYLLEPLLKHYVDFKGRANRTQFWLWTLWMTGIFFLLHILLLLSSFLSLSMAIKPLCITLFFISFLWDLAIILPCLAITARRLHDTDRSAWWMLLIFVPFVGGLILIIFELLPGTPEENRFGSAPQA